MATVVFSPLIADIRGKTADAVFASWKGRPYVRQRVIPANPRTAAQTAVRNSLAEAVAIWQQLPTDLQQAYEFAAANRSISGYNSFVGRNRAPIQAGSGLMGPRRNTDAALPRIEIPTDMRLDAQTPTGKAMFKWTDPAQGADYWFGYLIYNLTDNTVYKATTEVTAMSTGEFQRTGLTVGADYAMTGYVHRLSDGEMVHAMTWGWTQNQ